MGGNHRLELAGRVVSSRLTKQTGRRIGAPNPSCCGTRTALGQMPVDDNEQKTRHTVVRNWIESS